MDLFQNLPFYSMWTVVNFEADNTVDVVPDFWFKNGLCEWPNKTNRMDTKTTIKRRIKPDEIHFKKYKARVILTNIGKYYLVKLQKKTIIIYT